MWRHWLCILVLSLLLQGCGVLSSFPWQPAAPASATASVVMPEKVHSLNGAWAFLTTKTAEFPSQRARWRRIQVPSNWYSQGFDHAGYAWYRLRFNARNQSDWVSSLRFNGVDYGADVWLNGEWLGAHEGYFQAFQFDASRLLRTGENTLLVRVNSPLETATDFSQHKRLIKGIFSHHDTRPGGAWSARGQERNTGGIWGDVTLQQTPTLQLLPPIIEVQPTTADLSQWQIHVAVSSLGRIPKGAQLQWEINGQRATQAWSSTLRIPVNNPQLWYPQGYGKPHLYPLTLRVVVNGKVVDQVERQVGFRQIRKSAQGIWYINQQRILLRGTNYIANQWLADMSSQDFKRDVNLMLAANINTVRVHAHVTAPAFYDWCDRLGLMVWQDFPLQWGYQDTPAFHREAVKQVGDMIQQLKTHPSIIQWTLHNEPPWDAEWMKWKYKDSYDPQQNKVLDERLYATARALERFRPIEKYSSTASHPWLGWYSGSWLDYAKPTKQSTIAEFGAQALPDRATLARILGEEPYLPRNNSDWETWHYFNFQRKETLEIAKVQLGDSLAEFINNTQQYQAQLIQLAAESYRRQAYQPVGAMFQFMLVEDWPSMNWGVVDFWRQPKPGYAALQRAYQPLLPSLAWQKTHYAKNEPIVWQAWLLNDGLLQVPQATYRVQVWRDKSLLDTQQWSVAIKPDQHAYLQDYTVPTLSSGDYRVVAQLWDQRGTLLSENRYDLVIEP